MELNVLISLNFDTYMEFKESWGPTYLIPYF